MELLGLAFGVVVASAVVLAGLLLKATHRVRASQADLAAERASRSALHQELKDAEAGSAAAEATISVLTTEREMLRQRLEPILNLEAERLRLAAALKADQNRLDQDSQRAHAAAERERRALESEVSAARDTAAQEILRAHEEARRKAGAALGEVEAELTGLRTQREELNQELRSMEDKAAALKCAINELDDTATLQSFGYYHKRYDFGTSAQYERLLEQVCSEQKGMVKVKAAATCLIEWMVNGSKREGQKQINQTLRLDVTSLQRRGRCSHCQGDLQECSCYGKTYPESL